ncbi:hypothetical protein ACFSUS_03190 [Spirosoma soli]|uniref:ABC transporter permease n=1 Tax=Spirosoma soli TaxID=1770529 RepID=A0ABW5LY72_9BACT
MNQTFSLTRFGRLSRKYFIDNRGALLANVGLLVGVLILMTFMFYRAYPMAVDRNRQVPFFIIGLAAWYVFTWQQADVLNEPKRAITYLLQPASQLEKIALMWLVSGVGFLLTYLLLFTLIDGLGVYYINQRQWTPEQQKIVGSYKLRSWFESAEFFRVSATVWGLSVLLHPFALVFSLWIRKYTFPLVALLAFLLLFLGIFLNSALLRSLTGANDVTSIIPFSNFITSSPTDKSIYRTVHFPQPIANQIRYSVGALAILLLYITAFYRLKEREV